MRRMIKHTALLSLLLGLVACGGKKEPEAKTPEPPPAEETAAPTEAAGTAGEAAPAEKPAAEEPPPPAEPDPAQVKAELLASEQSAYEAAKPVFESFCAKCHSKSSKKAKPKVLAHFDMTGYPFTSDHADEIAKDIREQLGLVEGKKAKMPKDRPGAVKGDDLAKIQAWADAFDKAAAGGAHEGAAAPADEK
jgi:hypothetical protein